MHIDYDLLLEQHLDFSEKSVLAQVCAALPKSELNEDWKAKSILMGLGFTTYDFDRPPSEFSSGFQVRIRLAEALVSESDLERFAFRLKPCTRLENSPK